jgi:enoyl-CoA hydratase/carnithine racemase
MPLTSLAVDAFVGTLLIDPTDGLADRALSQALEDTVGEIAAAADAIRAVVVVAAGADFCGAWSSAALAELEGVAGVRPLGAGFDALAAVPQPVVAALHGRVESAGLELALACDIRVAADDARFAMPETAVGIVPRGGGTQRLPRAVGRAQALRLLLLGDEIDAAEARRIGLVSRVVPSSELRDAAMTIARAIASRGPIATRLAKEAVYRGSELTLEQALRYELDLTLLLQTTADRAEGVRAFAAKRPPNFIGR